MDIERDWVEGELGALIRGPRKARRWSQERLAEEVEKRTGQKIDQGTISAIENGRTPKPTYDTIMGLATALDLDDRVLLRKAGYMVRDDGGEDGEGNEHFPLVTRLRADPEFMREYLALGPENVDEGLVEIVKAHLRAVRR